MIDIAGHNRVAGKRLRGVGCRGLTLVELLLALAVTSIVLSAVATLAFAMGRANETTSDMAVKQSQVRFATLKFSDLIRHGKLVCGMAGSDLAIWSGDTNDDGQINMNELVLIERGADHDYLGLCEFPDSNSVIRIAGISALDADDYSNRRIRLVPDCENVEFLFEDVAKPLYTRLVSITFDLSENNVIHHYQINAAVRGWAGNLLVDGEIVLDGDDD